MISITKYEGVKRELTDYSPITVSQTQGSLEVFEGDHDVQRCGLLREGFVG